MLTQLELGIQHLFDLFLYVLSGAACGFVIGMTGVGGGSFMTPLLLTFGFPPATAVGTDLLYAAITKAGGVISHNKQNTIEWKIVMLLASGSLPASLAVIFFLHLLKNHQVEYTQLLTTTLGIMLVSTGLVLLFRAILIRERTAFAKDESKIGHFEQKYATVLTALMGIVLGVFVTLSSVGAGAFGAAVLLILYPRMPIVKVIGTDLAHAIPLTAIAGLGHLQLGHVDFKLLLCLIVGSLPAISLGSKLANRLPDKILQPIMAAILLALGLKYLLF